MRAGLATLCVVAGATFASGEPSAAETGASTSATTTAATPLKKVASFPIVGTPFVSGSFIGTVEIEKFEAQGGRIVASTVLRRIGETANRATLQVRVAHSTCELLQLQVGPPKGATSPLLVTQHQGNSDLNTSEFCDIANANGVKAQVAALNKSGDVGAVLSCA